MGSKARWFAAVVLVLGCLSLAIAAWIHVNEINEWAPSFVQFGLMLIVPAVVALYEQRRGSLSSPVLLVVLWFPATLVVGADLLGVAVDPSVVYIYPNGIEALVWYAPIVFVPLVYALGRARIRRIQWLLAGVLAMVFLGALAYFTVGALVRPRAEPVTIVVAVAAICVWLALPLYYLGKWIDSRPAPAPLHHHPPALLAAVVAIVLPLAFATLGDGVVFVEQTGILGALVYPPVAYVMFRGGLHVLWRGRPSAA